jgi:chromosome segregation ATPase
LQEHNSELIVLTSKYGQVEVENIDLRNKLSKHVHEQQALKIAFNNEQANIATLQGINKQLLAKLEELQGNIDILTIQLKVSIFVYNLKIFE